MVTIKQLADMEHNLKGAITEVNKAWAHLDVFLKNNENLTPNHIELKNVNGGSYFHVYEYEVDTVKPTLMNTIKLALTESATRLANEAMNTYSEYYSMIAELPIEPIKVECIPTTYEDWCAAGKKSE